MTRAKFRMVYWNTYGPYSNTSRGGFARIPGQAALINAQKPTLFVALECHEETYRRKDGTREKAYMPLARLLKGLVVSEGAGGNQLFYDPTRVKVLKKYTRQLPIRKITKWNVTVDGVPLWIAGYHSPADASSKTSRKSLRLANMPFVLSFVGATKRGILCADWNSYSTTKGLTVWLLDKAGWKDLRSKSKTPVRNQQMNSHASHGGKPTSQKDGTGNWLDDIRTREGIVVNAGALIPTGNLSDHAMLVADCEVDNDSMIG